MRLAVVIGAVLSVGGSAFSLGRDPASAVGTASRRRQPSTFLQMADPDNHFDYLVIGAGSGGIASARRAATCGAKVAVAERQALGGTCVNVGCVPKKVMFNAASLNEMMHEAFHFGFDVSPKFDWKFLKDARDKYIKRLNGIYGNNLKNSGITLLEGLASFTGPNTVSVGGKEYTAKNILIAVGGKPTRPDVPGAEHCIDSDGFFELEQQPKKVAVIGAGYIAVEIAGIFNALESETVLFTRGETVLRSFDSMLNGHLESEFVRQGLKRETGFNLAKVVKESDGTLTLHGEDGRTFSGFNEVLLATGRSPLVEPLKLDAAGVKTTEKGYIPVDEFSQTNVEGVYALGDVIGKAELTPVAIAAGRRLSDKLFAGKKDSKISYDNIPTVIFSHPPIGTIGLTEEQAKAKYGSENVHVYNSKFVNLWYGPYGIDPMEKPRSVVKVVTTGKDEKVVGLHVIGMGSDELLQGFGVAMKMGCTKADLDNCIAIHPTAAEEVVTLAPWGLPHPENK